jgi:hypothetical protein
MSDSLAELPRLTINLEYGDRDDRLCTDSAVDRYARLHTMLEHNVSVLRIPADIERDWRDLPSSAYLRRRVNRAYRLGYEFAAFDFRDYRDDVHEINTSKQERQGRAMSESYLAYPDDKNPFRNQTCPRHRHDYVGIFQNGKLYAYALLRQCGEMVLFSEILGHGERLPDGIMYLLTYESIKLSQKQSRTQYGVYHLHDAGAGAGLQTFKHHMGFSGYDVTWELGRPGIEVPTFEPDPDHPSVLRMVSNPRDNKNLKTRATAVTGSSVAPAATPDAASPQRLARILSLFRPNRRTVVSERDPLAAREKPAHPTREQVWNDRSAPSAFPTSLVEGASSAISFFSAAFFGRNDVVFLDRLGVVEIALVDHNEENLAAMAEMYPTVTETYPADAFATATRLRDSGRSFDVVICDPFTNDGWPMLGEHFETFAALAKRSWITGLTFGELEQHGVVPTIAGIQAWLDQRNYKEWEAVWLEVRNDTTLITWLGLQRRSVASSE